jgi:hypothetical protein
MLVAVSVLCPRLQLRIPRVDKAGLTATLGLENAGTHFTTETYCSL